MSIIFASDTKGRLINMAHVVIIDRDNMAKLIDGTAVALVDNWDRPGQQIVAFGDSDVAGDSNTLTTLKNIESAITALRIATSS